MIISGVLWLISVVMSLVGIYTNLLPYFHIILWRLVSIALLVAGGVFALGGGIGESASLRLWLYFSLDFPPQLIMLGILQL